MSTITQEQQNAISALIKNMYIPSGIGNKHAACSIAAINLALRGILTDDIPECMSEVIGKWIIKIQDEMPENMRNSYKWKSLLPLAAGTGRSEEKEKERLKILIDWVWNDVISYMQSIATRIGISEKWEILCKERTLSSAEDIFRNKNVKSIYPIVLIIITIIETVNPGELSNNIGFLPHLILVNDYYSIIENYYFTIINENEVWEKFNPCDVLERLINV